jgi:hypothetical protein
MGETLNWMTGTSIYRPTSMFGGVRIIESQHLPDDKAYILNDGTAFVSPEKMAALKEEVARRVDGEFKKQLWDGDREQINASLTLDTIERARDHLNDIMKPVDLEKAAMEADPAWGSF